MSAIPLCESAGKADSIRPTGICAYFDRIGGWAQRPFTRADRVYLQQQCCKLYAPPPRRRRWQRDRTEQQYFDLTLPTDAALKHLGDGATVNYTEFALDWVFDYGDQRDDAATFANQHLVKRWHRASQGIRFEQGTRYTAGRHAGTNLVTYADQPSRITGELACCISNTGCADNAACNDSVSAVRKIWRTSITMSSGSNDLSCELSTKTGLGGCTTGNYYTKDHVTERGKNELLVDSRTTMTAARDTRW
jgi:hypothetical protein